MSKVYSNISGIVIINTTFKCPRGGRLCAVDLLIKVACFVKKVKKYFQYKKEMISIA